MSVYVFTGPTLAPEEARHLLDAVYLPPVAQGDVYRVTLKRPRAIGIIDGYFERIPAVWHKRSSGQSRKASTSSAAPAWAPYVPQTRALRHGRRWSHLRGISRRPPRGRRRGRGGTWSSGNRLPRRIGDDGRHSRHPRAGRRVTGSRPRKPRHSSKGSQRPCSTPTAPTRVCDGCGRRGRAAAGD